MQRLYINVPVGEDITEDETLRYPHFFSNLQSQVGEDEYGSGTHFKTTLMSYLLKRNKFIYAVEEVVELAYKLAVSMAEEAEFEELDVEEMLLDLVEDGYFVEVGVQE
ncbi:hypothetical protein CN918_32400 [Priestia megaterium]|nr:hypothetical protein CN918_32400 [Priestia megaterium]